MCWKAPNLTASLAYMALLPFEFLLSGWICTGVFRPKNQNTKTALIGSVSMAFVLGRSYRRKT